MKHLFKNRKQPETEQLKQTVAELKAKMEELKRENADLLFTLDEYTKKENSIFESIGYIEEKKREQAKNLNAKYALELERIKFFEQKWFNIVKTSADPVLKRYTRETREQFDLCRREIIAKTRNDLKMTKSEALAEEDFQNETVRLDRQKEVALSKQQADAAYYVQKALELSRAAETKAAITAHTSPTADAPTPFAKIDSMVADPAEPTSAEPSYADFVRARADYSPNSTTQTEADFPLQNTPTDTSQFLQNTTTAPLESRLKRAKMSDTDIVRLLEKFSV